MNELVHNLREGEQRWATTSNEARADLLAELRARVHSHATTWVDLALNIKQLPPNSPLVGEEWVGGPWATLTFAAALEETLRDTASGRDPLRGARFARRPGRRTSVEVLPIRPYDHLLFHGYRAEVWTQPGVSQEQVRADAGRRLRDPSQTQGVSLVLGAGNVFALAPIDVLHVLHATNRVVVLKLNPVADPLHDLYREIFEPYRRLGVVEIVSGDGRLGDALAQEPGIDAVHMTGSEATHDAIVWGTGPEGEVARNANKPRLHKPITSELGGVSPVIVVPGRWSEQDLRFQAENIATQRLHNNGHNCIASQVVVISSEWDQRDEFLVHLRRAMAAAPPRPTWYPGSAGKVQELREEYDEHDAVGGSPDRTVITGVDLENPELIFERECFGPVLAVCELPGTGEWFLHEAVDAVNERLRGTLGANLVIDPRTQRGLGWRLQEQIARLRYGTVAVNTWTAVGFMTPRTRWGAFPGHSLADVQSGIGEVNNVLMLESTERTVIHGPFRPGPRALLQGKATVAPKPPWFVNNKTATSTARLLTDFAARPRLRALPRLFGSALRG